jgi:small subunit ribosomal protein S14
MAKLSSVEKNKNRAVKVKQCASRRARLKAIATDKKLDFADRFEAIRKLSEMPKNGAKIRLRNRCALSGRSRAVYRKFNLSRIALRTLGNQGLIPGLVKASW